MVYITLMPWTRKVGHYAPLKHSGVCSYSFHFKFSLNFLLFVCFSDKEEEQQNDLDHKVAAASAGGNNCHLGGWRGLVTAAIFFLTLTLIVLHDHLVFKMFSAFKHKTWGS